MRVREAQFGRNPWVGALPVHTGVKGVINDGNSALGTSALSGEKERTIG